MVKLSHVEKYAYNQLVYMAKTELGSFARLTRSRWIASIVSDNIKHAAAVNAVNKLVDYGLVIISNGSDGFDTYHAATPDEIVKHRL
jgi:hypothetical protein